MNQTLPTSPNHIRGVARWSTGAFALLATVALGGCGSTDSSAGIARMQQALEDPLASSCGYQVEAGLYASGKKGYQAWLEVTNVSGDPATEFSVFIDPHGTEILESYHADYESTDGGYLFSAPNLPATGEVFMPRS